MKVLILGIDGYIGWSLALHLLKKGHIVSGFDNYSRRNRVRELGSDSLTPIVDWSVRSYMLQRDYRNFHGNWHKTLGMDDPVYILDILSQEKPDVIIHLAEQPSAAYSMKDVYYSGETQEQNVIGTLHLLWAINVACPSAHLIKLGTMGEYGTPNCDIPEGRIPEKCIGTPVAGPVCPMNGLLFPRTAGSFYHLSKVMDSLNIEFCCRNWGLTSTDIMQGVVFGLNEFENETEITRFDYDECFGTVINRFCVQAIIEHPLTIYGKGGQTRGFLPLKDSLQCIELAMLNPPKQGEYRTLNQFESTYNIISLADGVSMAAHMNGLKSYIQHIPNPRKEMEEHYYSPTHQKLFDLGYKPTQDIQGEINKLISQLLPYKDRVIKDVIEPKINWR